jgi:hypothetical protein
MTMAEQPSRPSIPPGSERIEQAQRFTEVPPAGADVEQWRWRESMALWRAPAIHPEYSRPRPERSR